jgi:hypothetical protein
MKAETVYNQFLKTAKYLLKELDFYGENQFRQRISEGHMTIGELYDYLLNSTTTYFIPQIKACLDPQTGNNEGKKKLKGKFVLWYGRIPAIMKYNDLSNYKPVQPENPESMKDNLYKFIKVMHRTAMEIDNSDSKNKIAHPVFGMLTAVEWFSLVEMNFKHLLKNKEEIDRVLRNVGVEDN